MVSRKNIEPKLDVNLGFVGSGADYTNILDNIIYSEYILYNNCIRYRLHFSTFLTVFYYTFMSNC